MDKTCIPPDVRCEKYQVTHAKCKYKDHNLKFDMPPPTPFL